MQEPAEHTAAPPQLSPWQADLPYNQLPLLPPAVELESHAVLKQCIQSRASLAELKQAAGLIPNETVLIRTLPLLEAQSSSEIENIVTTTDQLFRFQALDEQTDPATKEAARYSPALLEGFRSLEKTPLCTRTAEQVCSLIKGQEMQVRKVPGTALADQTNNIIYTPPAGEPLLRGLLADWERFMHEQTGLDPLVRLAVGHYQFEAIHPFTDGNGRTGRVLNSLFLVNEGLLNLPILYLSRYINQHRGDYYRLLLEVTTEGKWEEWLLYLIRGIEVTADWTRKKIETIRQLFDYTSDYVRCREPKVYSHELVTLIFELPYCRIQNLMEAGIAKRQTASRYLQTLVNLGVLEEIAIGREKLFVHPKYLQLLTTDSDKFAPYE